MPATCPHCNRAEGHDLPRPPFTPNDESQTALSKRWSRTFETPIALPSGQAIESFKDAAGTSWRCPRPSMPKPNRLEQDRTVRSTFSN
jgi:hypothetical protein